jgi:hypothetical protein
MSMRTLESAILHESREILKYRSLRLKDIMEWSTRKILPHDGEVRIRIPYYKVWVCVKKEHDKRK